MKIRYHDAEHKAHRLGVPGETYDERYREIAHERRRAARKKWENDHKEYRRGYNHQFYLDHKEHHSATNRVYYQVHRTEILAAQTLRRSFDRKGNRTKDRAYYWAHRDHILERRRERDAKALRKRDEGAVSRVV